MAAKWTAEDERNYVADRTVLKKLEARGEEPSAWLAEEYAELSKRRAEAKRRHPTEKPVSLLRQLIESSSCFGDLVLDPFAGVGSSLVAALLEGRRAVGIELEEKYCETAAKRLESLAGLGEVA